MKPKMAHFFDKLKKCSTQRYLHKTYKSKENLKIVIMAFVKNNLLQKSKKYCENPRV